MMSNLRALDTSYRRRKKCHVDEDHECDVFQSRLSSINISEVKKKWFWEYRDSFQVPWHVWSVKEWWFWRIFLSVSDRHAVRSVVITSNWLHIVYCRIRNHSHVSTFIFWPTFESYLQCENDYPCQRIDEILTSRESSFEILLLRFFCWASSSVIWNWRFQKRFYKRLRLDRKRSWPSSSGISATIFYRNTDHSAMFVEYDNVLTYHTKIMRYTFGFIFQDWRQWRCR